MERPTQKQIDEAKAYIRRRLDAEGSMLTHLNAELKAAAGEIVNICMKYGIEPKQLQFATNPRLKAEVDAVIETLIEVLYDDCITLSVAEREDDDVYAFAIGKSYGKTPLQRITEYSHKFMGEVEAAVAAGLLYKLSSTQITNSIATYLTHPYDNPIIKEAIKEGGFRAEALNDKSRASAQQSLELTTRQTIANTWMHAWFKDAKDNGSIGFWSERGSSYPCEECDSQVGFHTWDEPQPPYHPRCVCVATPIYN